MFNTVISSIQNNVNNQTEILNKDISAIYKINTIIFKII